MKKYLNLFMEFSVSHGEKVAITFGGIFFACTVFYFFTGKGVPAGLTKHSRADFDNSLATANENLDGNAQKTDVPRDPRNYGSIVTERLEETVALNEYRWSGHFYRKPTGRGQRQEPEWLAAVDPIATAGYAAIQVNDPNAGLSTRVDEETRRRVQNDDEDEDEDDSEQEAPAMLRPIRTYRYVAVRALAPIQEQQLAFIKAKVSENPEYLSVNLERQALLKDGTWPSTWKTIDANLETFKKQEASNWATRSEVIPLSYFSQSLTCPLPNRLIDNWNPDGTHPKLGALVSVSDAPSSGSATSDSGQGGGFQGQGGQGGQGQGGQGGQGGGFQGQGGQGGQQFQLPLQQGGGFQGQGGQGGQGGGFQGQGGQGGQGGGFQGQGGQGGQGGQASPAGQSTASAGANQWLLFRFIDFTIEPGNTYRYRVQLTLKNPNFELPRQLLENGNSSLAEGEMRDAEWSLPTDPVPVPNDLSYLLVSNSAEDPGQADLVIFCWDEDSGTFAADPSFKEPRALTLTVSRGDIIGFDRRNSQVVNLRTSRKEKHTIRDRSSGEAMIDVFGGRQQLLNLGDDFPAEIRTVDIPATMLVLDGHGRLIVHKQNEDVIRWEALNNLLVAQQESAIEEPDPDEVENDTPGGQGQGGQGGQGGFQGQQ